MPELAGTPTLSPLAAQALTGLEQQLGIPAAFVRQFEQGVQNIAGTAAGQFLQGKGRGRYDPSLPLQVPYDDGHNLRTAPMTVTLNITYGVGSVPSKYYVVNVATIS